MNKYLIVIIAALVLGCKDKRGQDELFVKDVMKPVISLDGTWQVCINPADNFMDSDAEGEWKDIKVPGELMMQGFPVRHDKPFVYKRIIRIPSDYKGKIIRLRFEGVYSYARVWVNGNYIRDHSGGFTAWECDISPYAEPGSKSLLVVEVTDRADEISYASGYAKHPIGGILRGVSLISLPANHPEEISISTDLDDNYKDAMLTVSGKISGKGSKGSIKLKLVSPDNREVPLNDPELAIPDTVFTLKNLIQSPVKWDAEHPNLYKLQVMYLEEGKILLSKWYSVGFRELEIRENKFLVNGVQIRLKGACRHDIHPLSGRAGTPEYDLKDVLIAKEANMNFIRTSHYPPTDYFLQLCDKYGLYVEDETAVCFVGTHRLPVYAPGNTEDDSAFTTRYLSQLREMVYEHRNHPSVILWSIGNENQFGRNFKQSYDWVKRADPGRPVIFSYPGQVPDSIKAYDVLSIHYPEVDGSQ
jgi:beta-galactosidase/beta-glucuronidase